MASEEEFHPHGAQTLEVKQRSRPLLGWDLFEICDLELSYYRANHVVLGFDTRIATIVDELRERLYPAAPSRG